ncbi:MAG: nucleotidyltransferase domain-containing protein [Bacteroidetes bacterium]|nr:nucleotidyltransferase domain-containing protein [Bacteroidota bacterium]MCW5894219.1 nucleotidyltransferase domain-containing protein [Bacteroidota bacterium]
MAVHNVLDYVFAAWSHVAVLRVVQDSAVGMTGREIARLAQMSHRSCLKALTTLEQLAIIQRQRGGRDHRFLLNRDHVLVKHGVLPLLKSERSFLNELTQTLVRGLGTQARSVVLYGSAARKEDRLDSDLDICVVVATERDVEQVQSSLQDLASLILRRFGARLAPLLMTSKDFVTKVKNNKAPVSSILKEGIVLHGRSLRELARG